MTDTRPWLPADFEHPLRVELPTGHHLRPVRASDAQLSLVAVRGSRTRLWSIYGPAWSWPPADPTLDEETADLAHHETEISEGASYSYALFDAEESALLGFVYVDPPVKEGADAEICWWVVDELVGSDVAAALDDLVPRWIGTVWPLRRPRYVGWELSWAEWLALPEMPHRVRGQVPPSP